MCVYLYVCVVGPVFLAYLRGVLYGIYQTIDTLDRVLCGNWEYQNPQIKKEVILRTCSCQRLCVKPSRNTKHQHCASASIFSGGWQKE
jgi:hypothetical protein